MPERWFRREQLIVFAAVVGGLTVVAVVVTAVIVTTGDEPSPAISTAAEEPVPSVGAVGVDASDIVFPRHADNATPLEQRRFREPLARWQEEQIDRFWIDPQSIAADYLVEENDRLMEELFDTIP